MRPIVALLTDFGSHDHYVGAVKGAVLAACPDANLVDITHEVPAHDVSSAAWTLAFAYRAFPGRTVFLAVVDPGVGSARRALAVEAGGYRFVGPDNGVLGRILAAHPEAVVHEITNAGLFRHEVSTTFHARDVFGPVAGHLAKDTGAMADVGARITDPVVPEIPGVKTFADGLEWEATVVHVDHFGNLVTSFDQASLSAIWRGLGEDRSELVAVVDGQVVPLVRTYADVQDGDACVLVGSSGLLEVAVNKGSAARLLGATLGAPVRLRAVAAEGS
jgi:S-adenosylmethionine hydrolase